MSATAAPMYATMGVSSLASIGTAVSQAQAIKATGRYKASLARTNAALADQAETQTIEAGDITASRKNLETKQRVGSELAQQGGSGISVNSGSNAIARLGTDLVGGIDEATIRNNAARRAFGYKVQAIQDRSDIEDLTTESEAKQTLLSGGLKAVSGPLDIWAGYQKWSRYMGGGSGGKTPSSYIPGMEDFG